MAKRERVIKIKEDSNRIILKREGKGKEISIINNKTGIITNLHFNLLNSLWEVIMDRKES